MRDYIIGVLLFLLLMMCGIVPNSDIDRLNSRLIESQYSSYNLGY